MAAVRKRRPVRLAPPREASEVAAAQPEGLEEEVALLRVVIRDLVARGEVQEARRQIDTLCRVLRTRYMLDDRAADSLAEALARTLEEAGRAWERGS